MNDVICHVCHICGELKPLLHPERHTCPPRWQVWYFDGADSTYDPEKAACIYARDQEKAATQFCNRDSKLNNRTVELMVERMDTGERFKIWVEAYVVWRYLDSEQVGAPMTEDREPDA